MTNKRPEAHMKNPSTDWIKFSDREPTKAEIESDRLVGYFRINDYKGAPVTDHYGKLFWVDDAQTWAVEIFSNALRLTVPGQFDYEPVKPTHWCLVPELPDHPDVSGHPET